MSGQLATKGAGGTPYWRNIGDRMPDIAILSAKVLIILLITYLASGIISRRSRSGFQRGGVPVNVAILLSRVFWFAAWATGILLAVYSVSTDLSPIAAFIGVLGLAISLSLQTVLQNLVAGIYLLIEKPFNIGDTIAVVGPNGANHEGTVEDIQMRTTHLRSRDNELILMPNAAIFGGVVTNRTAVGGFAGKVTVTFPRDVEPEDVRQKAFPVLQSLPSILSIPAPQLRVDVVREDTWTASLSFWAGSTTAASEVTWALGRTFPEACVNDGAA